MARSVSGDLNKILLKELLDARAEASMARAKTQLAEAKVSKVMAKIEAAGKQVGYKYQDGSETILVTDIVLGS
jgi:hypothetical protein